MEQPKSNSTSRILSASFLPLAYHPCVAPLAGLDPISIGQLQLETHHRGRLIVLRSMASPWRMNAITTVAEDEKGDAVMLQLYHQEEENVCKAVDILDSGTVVIVKEPYFVIVAEGIYGVRIDHLSDVVILHEINDRVPDIWKPRIVEVDRSADWYKHKGNDAVTKGSPWDAIE